MILMASIELEKFISTAKSKNVPDDQIRSTLVKSGWSETEVNQAFSPQSPGINLPPPPVPHFGMWVSFQYIILFICLYVSATSFGGILHAAVNDYLPDNIDNTYSGYGNYFDDFLLKGYLAGIAVTFPVFAILFLLLKHQLLIKPGVKSLRARKILIYLTLVGTFIIMISHLIMTVYGFLGGNTTLRSLAHLGVTFLVAGSIFVYLLNEVREDRKS